MSIGISQRNKERSVLRCWKRREEWSNFIAQIGLSRRGNYAAAKECLFISDKKEG